MINIKRYIIEVISFFLVITHYIIGKALPNDYYLSKYFERQLYTIIFIYILFQIIYNFSHYIEIQALSNRLKEKRKSIRPGLLRTSIKTLFILILITPLFNELIIKQKYHYLSGTSYEQKEKVLTEVVGDLTKKGFIDKVDEINITYVSNDLLIQHETNHLGGTFFHYFNRRGLVSAIEKESEFYTGYVDQSTFIVDAYALNGKQITSWEFPIDMSDDEIIKDLSIRLSAPHLSFVDDKLSSSGEEYLFYSIETTDGLYTYEYFLSKGSLVNLENNELDQNRKIKEPIYLIKDIGQFGNIYLVNNNGFIEIIVYHLQTSTWLKQETDIIYEDSIISSNLLEDIWEPSVVVNYKGETNFLVQVDLKDNQIHVYAK